MTDSVQAVCRICGKTDKEHADPVPGENLVTQHFFEPDSVQAGKGTWHPTEDGFSNGKLFYRDMMNAGIGAKGICDYLNKLEAEHERAAWAVDLEKDLRKEFEYEAALSQISTTDNSYQITLLIHAVHYGVATRLSKLLARYPQQEGN